MKSGKKLHCLYLSWGKLQIGAFGIPAIATLLLVALMGFFGRWIGVW